MPKAIYRDKVIAEAPEEKVQVVEGNVYFPPDSVDKSVLTASPTPYTCGWKGDVQYFDVVVNGDIAKDAAWTYPDTKPGAKYIEGWYAFWKGVKVER